jgi:hypothetical protein
VCYCTAGSPGMAVRWLERILKVFTCDKGMRRQMRFAWLRHDTHARTETPPHPANVVRMEPRASRVLYAKLHQWPQCVLFMFYVSVKNKFYLKIKADCWPHSWSFWLSKVWARARLRICLTSPRWPAWEALLQHQVLPLTVWLVRDFGRNNAVCHCAVCRETLGAGATQPSVF